MSLSPSLRRKVEAAKKSGVLNLQDEGLTTLSRHLYDRTGHDNFFEIVDLVQLNVSHNALTELPEDLGILFELKLLDVSHNHLSTLPPDLFTISELRSINIGHNAFRHLPEEICRMTSLVSLSCEANQLTELPDGMGSETIELTRLDASENGLTGLPMSMRAATALMVLDLKKNKIETFPGAVLPGLNALTELYLDANGLKTLPEEVRYLKQLKTLGARNNLLETIPEGIAGCTSLVELHLGNNRIQTVTDAIGALQELMLLDLNTNDLQSFPSAPCKGMKLHTLDLANNNLTGLPGEVGLITTLKRLPLDGNPLRTIRRDLTTGPISRLLDSLRKKLPVDASEEEAKPYGGSRVLITGDPFSRMKTLLQSYELKDAPGEIDMSKMGLKEIPQELWMRISYVGKLDLNDNDLTSFEGDPLIEASHLKILKMQNCNLQKWPLPLDADCLTSLTELDLSRNKRLEMPDNAFASCSETLTQLDLTGVPWVSTLPEGCFLPLRSLRSISLAMTRLSSFPLEFVTMPTLTVIDVSQNEIQTIPEDITKLTRLEYLDVSNNSISILPVQIGFMDPVLKAFKVEDDECALGSRVVILVWLSGCCCQLESVQYGHPSSPDDAVYATAEAIDDRLQSSELPRHNKIPSRVSECILQDKQPPSPESFPYSRPVEEIKEADEKLPSPDQRDHSLTPSVDSTDTPPSVPASSRFPIGISRHRIFSFSKLSEPKDKPSLTDETQNGIEAEKAVKVASAESEFEQHDIEELTEDRSDWLWFSVPSVPVAGAHCVIYFNKGVSEALKLRPKIQIIRAFNEWELDNATLELKPVEVMREDGSEWWSVDFVVPHESYEMNFVFTDGEGAFDNNYGQDFLSAVHWGITRDEWMDGGNARAQAEMDRRMAEEETARREEEKARAKKMEEEDAEKAKWRIGELKGGYRQWQEGASTELLSSDGSFIWKLQSPIAPGKSATLFYNYKSSMLSHLSIPPSDTITLKIGHNSWNSSRDVQMHHVIGEDDVWSATFDVPIDAVALNFVFAYGEAFDNNNLLDYRAEVSPPPSVASWEDYFDQLLPGLTQIERDVRLQTERERREREAKREAARKAAMDKAMAVGRRQIKHVLFTDPPVLEAGQSVTVYYCPNHTPLNGKDQIYITGGWNRWTHKRKLGPIKMQPPGDGGSHWRAKVDIPLDVFMMDFVFADVEEGDGTYDNRGGFDYHLSVTGSLAKEPPLHIVHVSVEMAPIAKVGGLGDVVTSLGRAVKEQGHLVEVILPRFDFLLHSPMLNQLVYDCEYEWGGTHIYVTTQLVEGLRVFFIEPKNHMFAVDAVYGRSDDAARFEFFNRAALQFLLISGRQPDIVHCHDWPTAGIAKAYWEDYHHWGLWKPRVVFTIHNLNYGDVLIGQAACYSQRFTTVSPTYAFEVGNHPAIGPNVQKFMGIRNGIDTEIWDPENDQFLPQGYCSSNLEDGKRAARMTLAHRIGIDGTKDAPIVSVVSRLTAQKGVDLIKHAAWRVLDRGGIFVLLGSAPDPKIQADFEGLANSLGYAGSSVRFCFAFDEPLSHLIYAASDFILVPSMFEPCGLTQMIAMRYGSIPVVRHTGGLRDTVFDVDFDKDRAAWEIEGSSDWVNDGIDATNGFAFAVKSKTQSEIKRMGPLLALPNG